MSASSQAPAPVDPEALKNAQAFWANFTKAGTYGIIGIALLLLVMWATLV